MEELLKISLEVHQNPNIILPYVELKLASFELQTQESLLELTDHEQTLLAIIHQVEDMPNFEEEFEKVLKYKELMQKKQLLIRKLSDEYLSNYPEYESRVKVLKELNYIDNDDRGKIRFLRC